jgi:phospholipid transport system transporter-binding protein
MAFALPAVVTHAQAPQLETQLLAAIRGGEAEVDCGAITQLDSSLITLLLAARRTRADLRVANATAQARSLAQLYGVEALLGLPVSPTQHNGRSQA